MELHSAADARHLFGHDGQAEPTTVVLGPSSDERRGQVKRVDHARATVFDGDLERVAHLPTHDTDQPRSPAVGDRVLQEVAQSRGCRTGGDSARRNVRGLHLDLDAVQVRCGEDLRDDVTDEDIHACRGSG